jgi:hypothetical protein
MKRKPLWILIVVCLYAGCVARPPSEAQVVVSKILHEQRTKVSCRPVDVRYCEADVDGLKYCTCVNRDAVLGRQ